SSRRGRPGRAVRPESPRPPPVLSAGLAPGAGPPRAGPCAGGPWPLAGRALPAADRIGLRVTRGRGRVDLRLAVPDDHDPHATTLRLAAPPGPPDGAGEAQDEDEEKVSV